MSRPLRQLEWGESLSPRDLVDDVGDFLRRLGVPTLLRVTGRDRSRTRVIATLLHGNEPSGVRALVRWLAGEPEPAVDCLVLIANVEAALAPPGFAHRFLPGARDLNRCFRAPFDGWEGALAGAALERLVEAAPECLVDLHNNTGHNPAYGVAPRAGTAERKLVSFFAERFVHAPLDLGTLVEVTQTLFPSVAVECGRSGDAAADAIALAGIEALASAEDLGLATPPGDMEMLVDPVRVCVRKGVDLAFGDGPEPGVDLTISRDIDRHSFEPLEPGTPIGWLGNSSPWPVEARGASGADRSAELFVAREGILLSRRGFVPVMMTTNREGALNDCLFYAVQPGESP